MEDVAKDVSVACRLAPGNAKPKPESITIPAAEKPPRFDPNDAPTSDDDGVTDDFDDAVSIGVSISKEQTRLMSPTTPAAEKSAALDKNNSWGFFDGEDAQVEVLRNTLQNTVISNLEGDSMRHPVLGLGDSSAVSQPLPLSQTAKDKAPYESTVPTLERHAGRPRASTTNALADSSIRKFFSTLSFPSIPEPWAPRHKTSLSISGILKDTESGQKRRSRSNSLLPGKWTWPLQSRSESQSRAESQSREQSPTPQSPPTTTKRLTFQWERISRTPPDSGASTRSIHDTVLRRSASDDSLLRPRLSRHTTIETIRDDISKWEHINSQVNSRGKAIRDSLQDSLPYIPNINLSAFRPDNALRSLRETNITFPRSMTTVFRNDIAALSEPSKTRTPSPSKAAARSKWPSFDAALEMLEGDVVIMGGYRGSVLRSAEPPHRQLWVPVKVGLNIRKVDLEVGLNPEDEENMEQQIFASEMLTNIGPVDVARRLLKKLRRSRNAREGKLRVHEYAYDWRLSPALLSRRLIAFLEGLPCNSSSTSGSKKGATVLAHSMGGLITRHAVNKRPELFAGVTSAGTPHHCVNILGPLRNGDEVLLSSKVLTAQVNFTFRTSFLLLPENGQCFIDKTTKEQYDVDFFAVESWQRYALSPCISSCLPAYGSIERKSLMDTLSNSLPSLMQSFSSSSDLRSLATPPQSTSIPAQAQAKMESALHSQEVPVDVGMQQQPLHTGSSIPVPVATAYLKRTLAEVRQFKQELRHREDLEKKNLYPPHAIIYGTSVPTVYGARVASRDAIKHADAFDDLAFASGDGVVLARAAMMPPGYKVVSGGRVHTDRGHIGILGDLEAVGKCLLAMMRARAKGVGVSDKGETEQQELATGRTGAATAA